MIWRRIYLNIEFYQEFSKELVKFVFLKNPQNNLFHFLKKFLGNSSVIPIEIHPKFKDFTGDFHINFFMNYFKNFCNSLRDCFNNVSRDFRILKIFSEISAKKISKSSSRSFSNIPLFFWKSYREFLRNSFKGSLKNIS